MKRIIITTVSILMIGTLIGWVLLNNRSENEAKTALVAQTDNSIAVTVSEVVKQSLSFDFSSNGNFTSNQELELSSETSGRISKILVNEGARVSKGQVLAYIESEVVNLELRRAEDSFKKLQIDYERYTSSFETGGVTKAQLDEIELALRNAETQLQQTKRRVSDANIKAPIAGVINKRTIEVGSFVSPGTPLFEIIDASHLKLKVTANEYQVVKIKKGDRVSISTKVFPDILFTGTVSFIAEKADNSLNYPIEITVENEEKQPIKAGMYATAKFEFPEGEPRVVVDRSAFVGSVHNNQVYVYTPDTGTVQLRNVVAGRIIGEQVEILEGLEEGEIIVTSGQINLTDGARVELLKQ